MDHEYLYCKWQKYKYQNSLLTSTNVNKSHNHVINDNLYNNCVSIYIYYKHGTTNIIPPTFSFTIGS